ncbi:MAG: hypothetical protein K2N74_00965, partial [Clostridiales bacterium]|nr:hypothetical protein [Clostridiales bacterium]
VDYKILSEQFANSSRLQKTYSMKWVCDNYQAIVNGLFADKPDNELSRGEWENWLSNRRTEAEIAAENTFARAMADNEYNKAHTELKTLSIDLAFAEVKGNRQQDKIKSRIEELKAIEYARLKELDINEADFTPRYHCEECGDTGYLSDGTICKDCWEKFKEYRNGQTKT